MENVVTFGDDFKDPVYPGEAREYYRMLHALCKLLAIEAGGVHYEVPESDKNCIKHVLAQWTRGIWDTEAGIFMRSDVEQIVRHNRIAESLEELWTWADGYNEKA